MAFDSEAFGMKVGLEVQQWIKEAMAPLEARIAALEAARVKALEDEVHRLRGTEDKGA